MKDYVVEIRRHGGELFAARYEARSAKHAAQLALSDYTRLLSTQLLVDRLGEKFNPGWSVFSVAPMSGFRVLVKDG